MSDLPHVKGLAELDTFLQQLPVKMERNILRSALRAGAKVVQDRAKQNIHSVSGVLAASIKVGTRARGGKVTATVGTRIYYAKFVEYGTRPHTIQAKSAESLAIGGLYGFFKSVDHPGIVHPSPFLRPAFDAKVHEAVVAIGEQVKRRLTKEGLDVSDVLVEGDE